ncbi:MAG: helix-turn-helix domain-containing protein [Planctomycetota bacterium]|jgi:excisionase family DNA binding protein
MAKSGEFYTFDEVVRQLKIDEGKLKRLVSEGEISAFREGDVMKFKRTEIDKLSTKSGGSETSETVLSEITLEDEAPAFEESGETLTDDLVFESSDTGDKVGIDDQAGLATEEISSQDTFIEDVSDDVGMTTEPIDLSADLTEEVEEEEIEEVATGGQRAASRPQRGGRRVAAATEAPAGNPGITFALVLSSIVVFLAFSMTWRSSDEDTPLGETGMMRNLSNMVYEKMGQKKVQDEIKVKTKAVRDKHRDAVSTGGAAPEGG